MGRDLPDVESASHHSDSVAAEGLIEWLTANGTAAQCPELDALLRAWRRPGGGLDRAGRRRAFASLKTVGLLAHLASTESSQTWAASGYPAPAEGTAPERPRLEPLRITRDTEVDCGVVIVGSGPAAGVAAAVLAASGIDAIVLAAADSTTSTADTLAWQAVANRFGPIPGSDPDSVAVLRGSCRGGEQVVNHTAAFRTSASIRAEWADWGARQFAAAEYDQALDAVCEKLGATTEPGVTVNSAMARGLGELGWHSASVPRLIRGCDTGKVTGSCPAGCPLGAGQAVKPTWLHDAAKHGARMMLGVNVDTVLVRHGKAIGVAATSIDGYAVRVRASAVVMAGAATGTAALLIRSGLQNPNIGRHLRLHPHLMVFAEYADGVESWDQSSMPFSSEHGDLDGDGYGVRYVGQPLSPWMLAYGPWTGAADFSRDRSRLHCTSTILVVVRDHGSGHVSVAPTGQPRIHYRVSGVDRRHLQIGVMGAMRIAAAGGAHRIWPQHTNRLEYRSSVGSIAGYLRQCAESNWAPGHFTCYTTHQLGTARMGGSPATSATDPDGATWEVRNLIVADGSCLPTATGVNPMISIEAVAYMNAKRLAAALA